MHICGASTGGAEAEEGGNGIDNESLLVSDAWREGKLPMQLEGRLAEGKTPLHQLGPDSADREAQEAVHYGRTPERMVCQGLSLLSMFPKPSKHCCTTNATHEYTRLKSILLPKTRSCSMSCTAECGKGTRWAVQWLFWA